jgi:methionyl-tRNA formyltransferase
LKIVFAGTPDFARVALEALSDAGHEIALVLTRPDQATGRGLKRVPSPIKHCALQHGWALAQPASLRLDGAHPDEAREAHTLISQAGAEVMIVAAYGLILPVSLLTLPARGCLNIHASLLPRWRGAAPIERAIEAGDEHTGVCIMQMEQGLDTGPVLLHASQPILPDDSAASLRARLQLLGGRLIVEALAQLAQNKLVPVAQSQQGVTYAPKLAKSEASLRFGASALELARRIRAFDPHPGASAVCGDITLKLWQAHATEEIGDAEPGTIIATDSAAIHVRCAEGVLAITELQRPGGKRLQAHQFLQGFPLAAGIRLR